MVEFTDGCNDIYYPHPAWFGSHLVVVGLTVVFVSLVDERDDDPTEQHAHTGGSRR